MKQDENIWDASGVPSEDRFISPDNSTTEARGTRSSTERGSAADKALLDAGGAIVSRLRLRPIAARALAILMEREGDVHGRQRAAIERALIASAGGAEVLEQLLVEEKAAIQAEKAAVAALEQAASDAVEVAMLADTQRPRLSPIENDLVALLEEGPIHGTAEVGYLLWPDREMQPQGAACAANGILRRLLDRRYIESCVVDHRRTYTVTAAGRDAREQDRIDAIDPRQLTLLDS